MEFRDRLLCLFTMVLPYICSLCIFQMFYQLEYLEEIALGNRENVTYLLAGFYNILKYLL